jgi:predicted esterase
MRKKATNYILLYVLLSFVFFAPFNFISWAESEPETSVRLLEQFTSFSVFPSSVSWDQTAPEVRAIEIESSADGSKQPALYYDSGSKRKKPLLVALHSWSDNYTQKYSIPYAVWSVQNDWVFIHPDYRGAFNNPASTGSEQAVRDILDAVEYAKKNANIDTSRIYLAGFSGGAMTSLIMAGRHPDVWTAIVAWVPVFNLTQWYEYVLQFPNRHYAWHIISSCGGAPVEGSAAAEECNRRSPSAYLQNAKGKDLRIYLGHGINDDFAQPGHSLQVYNELADAEDRISENDIEYINQKGEVPSHLAGDYADELYKNSGKSLLFRKTSKNVTVSLFNGGHDVLYNAGLLWLSRQKKEE